MKRAVLACIIFSFVFAVTGCAFSRTEEQTDLKNEKIQEGAATPSMSDITDNISEINEDVLKYIAERYLVIYDFDQTFSEEDVIGYEMAFQTMKYAGVYRRSTFNIWEKPELMKYFDKQASVFALPAEAVEELVLEGNIERSELADSMLVNSTYIIDEHFWSVRPELYDCFNVETGTFTVPSEVVDRYVSSKFNTEVDRAQIKDYDAASDTYTFSPFEGDFYYNLSIKNTKVEDNIVRFTCLAVLDEAVQNDPLISHEVEFTVLLTDGEYRYLSVDVLPTSI